MGGKVCVTRRYILFNQLMIYILATLCAIFMDVASSHSGLKWANRQSHFLDKVCFLTMKEAL